MSEFEQVRFSSHQSVKKEIEKSMNDDLTTRININFWDYIVACFCKPQAIQKKFELLREGENKIRERLDIFNVMKKLREIDKLKMLLLDKDQLTLFDNLPKPVLEKRSRKLLKESLNNY